MRLLEACAVLNYAYTVLESELRIKAIAVAVTPVISSR